jgi:5-methylcytosine-specific restriction endonuclease McrA
MRKPYEGFNVCKKCGAPTKKAVVCGSCRVTAWRQKRKLKAIEYKGGKCILCGFSKYNSALEFHHLDPSQKDFALVSKTISWERMKEELDKCVLLCSNCHHAVHSKEVELPKDLIPQ